MRRPYRLSMRAYPPGYRRRHGDEMIETALAMHDGRWSARQAVSFLANGTRRSLVDPRRWWGLAVLFPLLLAAGQGADMAAHARPELPTWHGEVGGATWVAKWLTVPSLPVLLVLLAERIADHPRRWRVATALWVVLGAVVVVITTSAIGPVGEIVSDPTYHRLWPTTLTTQQAGFVDEVGGFGSNWTPTQIVARELTAMVLLAVASGLTLRHCARIGFARAAAGAVPLAVIVVLVVYRTVAPWAFRVDFDFFVGDAVLGSTLAELLFFIAPFDPIGSMAIGLAALTMGGLILAWGGARPGEGEARSVSRPSEPRSFATRPR